MTAERLVEALSRQLNRRRLIAKIGTALAGGTAVLLGLPRVAAASGTCCGLCLGNSGYCYGCSCAWCWTCSIPGSVEVWQCCECYDSDGDCLGGCNYVFCSWAQCIQNCPSSPAA